MNPTTIRKVPKPGPSIRAYVPWGTPSSKYVEQFCWVAECGKTQIGYIRAITDGRTTFLCDTFVHEGRRGEGIGTLLMQAMLSHGLISKTTIVLLTAEATGFYLKFGFTPRQAMIRRPDAA